MIGKRWGQTAPPTFPNRLYFPTPTTKRRAGEGDQPFFLVLLKNPLLRSVMPARLMATSFIAS